MLDAMNGHFDMRRTVIAVFFGCTDADNLRIIIEHHPGESIPDCSDKLIEVRLDGMQSSAFTV